MTDLFKRAIAEAETIVANRQDVELAAKIIQGRDKELAKLRAEVDNLKRELDGYRSRNDS